MKGLFVTGTDTEVGKTVISTLICARYHPEVPLAYWKPVASGSLEGRDVTDVAALSGAPTHPELYLFEQPLSPHLAARLEGERVETERILESYQDLAKGGEALIVEGVGGVHVPLNDDGELLSDLIPKLGLAAVVVARSTLGTINHTLLTLEALRQRGVEVAGVVLNGPPNEENRLAIERFGEIEVLAEVTPISPLDAAKAAAAAEVFDQAGKLGRYLRAS